MLHQKTKQWRSQTILQVSSDYNHCPGILRPPSLCRKLQTVTTKHLKKNALFVCLSDGVTFWVSKVFCLFFVFVLEQFHFLRTQITQMQSDLIVAVI